MIALLLASWIQDWRAAFDAEWKSSDPARQKAAVLALVPVDRKEVVDLLSKCAASLERRIAELEREKRRIQEEMKRIPADSLLDDKGKIVDRAGYEKRKKLDAESKKVEAAIVALEEVYMAFAEVFAKLSDTVSVATEARKSEYWRMRLHAVRGLGRTNSELAALEAAVDDPEGRVAVAALEALAGRGEGIAKIVAALERPEWQVRLAAAKALEKLDAIGGIEPLIAALEKSDGRMQHEINDVLVALTGEDKHGIASSWREWWLSNKAADRSPKGKRARAARTGGAGYTRFYGIPVKSKKMIFVLDRSGSMAGKAAWKEDGSVATGSAEGLKLVGDRKIDVCRYELKKVLLSLSKETEFNILFYNRDICGFAATGLVKATPENRKRAFAFLDSVEPSGKTNIFDSLEKAIGGDWKAQVDTIFLLSDGLPNCGQFEAPEDLRKELGRLNAESKIAVHAVYVGDEKAGEDLMRLLAKENGGEFVDRSKK